MITRRQFLIGGGVGAAAIAAAALLPPDAPLLWRWQRQEINAVPAGGRFSIAVYRALHALRGVTPVGKAFLAGQKPAPTPAGIEAWLINRLGIDDPAQVGEDAFNAATRKAIGADFAAGRVLDLDGWQVSATEARLAALRLLYYGEREPEPPAPFREDEIVEVDKWGPQGTEQGIGVNVQPDGHSGLWFKLEDKPPAWLKVEIDGQPADTFINGNVVTSGLHGAFGKHVLDTPGKHAIYFVDEMNRVRQKVGDFVVTPGKERAVTSEGAQLKVFCPIERWGPAKLQAGHPVNVQPDGSVGIWVRTACLAPHSVVRIDGKALESSPQPAKGLITARLPVADIAKPRHARLELHDPDSGESLPIGTLVISK